MKRYTDDTLFQTHTSAHSRAGGSPSWMFYLDTRLRGHERGLVST